MVSRQRSKKSSGPVTPNKKQNIRVVSEKEVFSPETLPIDDPWEEKEIVERQKIPYAFYLAGKHGVRDIGWTKEAVHNRIREVYRLCFESRNKMDSQVLRDFVAFHPAIVFDTKWFATLVSEQTVFEHPREGIGRKRMLTALRDGFKRAADNPSKKAWRRAGWIEMQRYLMNSFKEDLRKSYLEEKWNLNIPEWKKSEVPRKVDELVNQYAVLKKVSKVLKAHLESRQFRLAARLIVSTLWGVNKRTLDGKSLP